MRFLTFLLLITLSFCSCYQDEELESETTITTDLPEIIIEETDLYGQVIDNNGQVFTVTSLSINDKTYNASSSYFNHTIDNSHKGGQFITLKDNNDQITGLANAYLIENDVNYLQFKELPSKQTDSKTDIIKLSESLSITTTGVALYDQAGQVVQNDILVNHLQTNDEFILNNLGTSGLNKDGHLLAIKPQELVYFDFKTVDNQILETQLDAGFPISDLDALSDDLFFLDLERNHWVMIDLTQNAKLAQGFYLIASSTAGVYLEGQILKSLSPVSFMNFNWEEGDFGQSNYSTGLGRWASVTPIASDVNYNLNSPCGDFLQSNTLAAATEMKTDYEIDVDDNLDDFVQVETKVLDCEGHVESVPAIIIQNEGQDFVYLFNDDVIDTWIPVCDADFELGGYNILDDENGTLLNWSLGADNQIDYLSNCDDYEDGYSFIVIQNDTKLYEPFVVQYNAVLNETRVSELNDKMWLEFNGNVKGAYSESDLAVKISDPDFNNMRGYEGGCLNSGCGIDNFRVTHYDAGEGWLRISFSGSIYMAASTSTGLNAGDFPIEGVILRKL